MLTALLTAGLLATGSPAAAAPPTIYDARAFDAPQDEKGGVLSPSTMCDDYRVTPRNKMVLENLQTGSRKAVRWRGSGPGYRFPRVKVGRYEVRTTVNCRGQRAAKTQRVRIEQKTAKSTVSLAEWRQVERGMTRAQVRRIIGNGGRDPFTYRGRTSWLYDMMPFWRWSILTYRDGRVVKRFWNVGHD